MMGERGSGEAKSNKKACRILFLFTGKSRASLRARESRQASEQANAAGEASSCGCHNADKTDREDIGITVRQKTRSIEVP